MMQFDNSVDNSILCHSSYKFVVQVESLALSFYSTVIYVCISFVIGLLIAMYIGFKKYKHESDGQDQIGGAEEKVSLGNSGMSSSE